MTNNNRYNTDFKQNRAQEFLEEVKKACSKMFYSRFNMHLGNEFTAMGHNILGDFTCKWRTVEDSLLKALGDEQGVTRMADFLGLNYSKFVDQPWEAKRNNQRLEEKKTLHVQS